MKKQTLYTILGVVIMTLTACLREFDTVTTPTQPDTGMDDISIFATGTTQALIATPTATAVPATQVSGIPVSFEYVSFVIPDGLANGADIELVAGLGEEYEPWERYPTHPKFQLTGYLTTYGKYAHPEVIVYPAEEYAGINPNGAEQIDRLKKILAGTILTKETLPMVPFSGSSALITANIQIIPFQNGRGVRTLMQYGSYAGQINNEDLFYHFQGLTDDGKYHVIVNLPITAPILPATHDVSLPVPEGGVPFDNSLGFNSPYYVSVTEKLNALSPDDYTPTLNTLDALVQSILVTTP
ncbi:MAG TPA: hypothetical protein VHP14_10795 [Anaerolineales bacterium]|nr:hypothetical protein [Anaerolineales bacterium]